MHNKNNVDLERINFENKPSTVTPINATNLNLLQNNVDELCQTIQDDMALANNINSTSIEGLKGQILWTNPNPTNDLSAGNIILSSADYDVLEFYYNNDLTAPTMNAIKVKKGFGAHMSYMSNGSLRWWARRITYVNDTTFSVPDCILINSEGGSIDNAKCIPLYVVGYKTGLFDEVLE